MGLLQAGQWVDQWYETKKTKGEFQRQNSRFRHTLTTPNDAENDELTSYRAEADRYTLYVSLACPWAHRTLIMRQLKQLEALIDVVVVEPIMLENGWELDRTTSEFDYLYQLYLTGDPSYEGRVTVPVLWDKHTKTIVNNESSDILRIFNTAFNHLTGNTDDYYPEALRPRIDDINSEVYHKVNNGVYRAGFATTQTAYESAFNDLFTTLDWLEQHLEENRYLVGAKLTEADWRLFTTLVRFDAVYFGHFKTNKQAIADYPNLSNYLRELYQWPGIAETVNFDHIKTHYYASHMTINPTGIVPMGPEQSFDQPHNRDQLDASHA
ncbi:MAG: glutathione-dependent reductase [Cellvibrionaceae bacterium]|nr:glutathione-dependent reductase [Cellvibrionaceae bacterium]